MFSINWALVGNYSIAIIVTTALIVGVLHFSTQGRLWKTFSTDQYKCGMVQILSDNETPNLTGIFDSPKEASTAALNCNSPQAFLYDRNLCTLKDGKYTCFPEPANGNIV